MQMMTTDEGAQSTLQIVYDQCARIAEMYDNTQQITLQPFSKPVFSQYLLRKVFNKDIEVDWIELPVTSVLKR